MMKVKKLKEIFQDEEDGRLILPNFQREFVWDTKQQKELLATFLVELPISSILLLKGTSDDFNYRKLCYSNEVDFAKEECMYLLDGQQRMSTLKAMFIDLFKGDWENNYADLYGKIKNRWFLKVSTQDSENEDIFGYDNLDFDCGNLRKYTPSEIVDFIQEYKINKTTNTNNWYHPKFKFEKPTETGKFNEFANLCSEEKLIPLFGLNENKKLQDRVVEKIANKRSEEILDEIDEYVNDDKIEKIKLYFKDFASELEEDEILNEFEDRKNNLKADLSMKWKTKIINFLDKLIEQEISIIEIEKNEISRGIAIFETINKGGTPLDNYDLIVAKAAKDSKVESLTQRIKKIVDDGIDLSTEIFSNEKWNGMKIGVIEGQEELNKRFKNQYLNLLSIFAHVKDPTGLKLDHIKRDKIFEMTTEQINSLTEKTVVSLLRALAFINYRLGVTKLGNFSFELLLLPIAYILSEDKNWNDKKVLDKIEYWYWTSIFIGRFRERQNIRTVEDLKTLHKWINCNDLEDVKVKELLEENIKKVLNVEGYSDLETLLNESKTPGPVSKNLLGYILSLEPYDLLPGSHSEKLKTFEITEGTRELEDHHLIPLGTGTKYGDLSSKIRNDKNHILNSVLNRALISKEANRKIRDMGFEKYMKEVQEMSRIGQMINKNLQQKPAEEFDNYYKRVLEERFYIIKDSLIKELHQLSER
ncbi:MAG: GmrSD restriction endonuclease domain-containing protein [Fusobacteriaceae bacterium]